MAPALMTEDITIDNYEFTTDYLENATSGEKVVEETLVSHLLKSNCLITHQPDWGFDPNSVSWTPN